MAGYGLEARVPFGDIEFMRYIMSISPVLKMFDDNIIEKNILRQAFKNTELLPDELLFRRKEAFSDGISGHNRSWFTIIKEHVEKIITDDELKEVNIKI